MQHHPSHYNFVSHNAVLESYYQKLKKSHWIPEEVDTSKDQQDWQLLSKEEKSFAKLILAFFAQFDGLVVENLVKHFQQEVSSFAKEIEWFYILQAANELIHNETYMNLINVLLPPSKRAKALDAISNYESIRKIASWVEKWMDPSVPLPERIIAFAALEGVIFTGAFAAVYYFTISNRLKGLRTANEWISRDEALHKKFAEVLYNFLVDELKVFERVPQERCHEILTSAIEAVTDFIKYSLRLDNVNIDADRMLGYMKRAVDDLAIGLKYDKVYNAENTLDYMLLIGLENKGNFFEGVITDYSKGMDMGDGSFNTKAEF
ncbi:ribonucleoside-diphosphate reductase small chain [Noumeavirus]|uniref:ribonucleoside-diphosphate reductase n=1 Tax=Marseillevirus sp. TaxID=2809551 RepID=A0AA96EMV4_9VIRU|nr:ribonucleoside-diphosphate reductase small chain [Noumeavirus]AQM73168.1 ribonucleoside-diphosphate reductase small chain [Noumeavirus]AQQ73710.1 ribonucleoside-diphosphate reductase small subunit [Kurlavirus BKC-1]QZX43814.1 ribonucleoside-diphosphate reductase small chain [Marseillevirus sp.]WNL50380.1 ribonucleoside diphosphate reductase small chain [Marseillevirus sp.]